MEEAREYAAVSGALGQSSVATILGLFFMGYASIQAAFGIKDFRDGPRPIDDFCHRDRLDINSGFSSPGIFWFSVIGKFALGVVLVVLPRFAV